MSWNPEFAGTVDEAGDADSIDIQIVPRTQDLGGFEVRRALPAPERRMVGPFVFFDHIGPAEFLTGTGLDVRAHPHIGLATITYLLKGEFQHADSLGNDQMIYPGDVNWMIAGKGITHSERTSQATRRAPHDLYGIQTWVALPEDHEDTAPAFEHHGAGSLPVLDAEGITARLIIGSAYGERAPVRTFSDMFYLDVVLEPGKIVPLPDDHEDRGAYILEGTVGIAGDVYEAGKMMVFRTGDRITLKAGERGARVILLGGDSLNGPRHIWWNFVSSSREKIEAAKQAWIAGDWDNGPFSLPPSDRDEFIPAPGK